MSLWAHSQAGRSEGQGRFSRFAPVVVAILICLGTVLWLPQQPAIVPVDVLLGHSLASGNAAQDETCQDASADGSACRGDSPMQTEAHPASPTATEAEAENKQPAGSKLLTALLSVPFVWVLLRLPFASSDGVCRFAGSGLPAILRCHPRGSVAAIFCVFGL